FLHDICFFYRASLGGPDERREQKFATLVGDHFGMSPTNILLTHELYSLRWQIELLFKAWKSVFDLEKVKKMKKERFECHVYGTLIAILVTQTFLFQARTYWQQTEGIQISERKALDVLQFYWQQLLLRLSKEEISLSSLLLLLKKHGRKDRRKGKETALDLLVKLGIY
ncbi:transposase, partial [Anoxybacillus flavithermus]